MKKGSYSSTSNEHQTHLPATNKHDEPAHLSDSDALVEAFEATMANEDATLHNLLVRADELETTVKKQVSSLCVVFPCRWRSFALGFQQNATHCSHEFLSTTQTHSDCVRDDCHRSDQSDHREHLYHTADHQIQTTNAFVALIPCSMFLSHWSFSSNEWMKIFFIIDSNESFQMRERERSKCQKKPRNGMVGGIHVFSAAKRFSILVSRSLILLCACCSSSKVKGDGAVDDFLRVFGRPTIWSISCWMTLWVISKHLFKKVKTFIWSATSFCWLTMFSMNCSLDLIEETYLNREWADWSAKWRGDGSTWWFVRSLVSIDFARSMMA